MILVISHIADEHASEVLRGLARAGTDAVLFDCARFPREIRIAVNHDGSGGSSLHAHIDGVQRDLRSARAVWWRRPLPFNIFAEIDNADREFTYGECHAAVSGLWSCLEAKWMNDPECDEVSARKAWQLKLAASLGLRVPRTLITNDPVAARDFIEAEGASGTIYKAFSATEHAWRETRLLRDSELQQLDAVRYAPVIFQEYVRAEIDLRITVVGDEMFPAEVQSGSTEYQVDYRMTMHQAAIRAHVLPDAVVAKLRAFMTAARLIYGAIDMRLTPQGEYVFLEVNPAGQWLFIEQRTDLPITAAVIAQLQRMNR